MAVRPHGEALRWNQRSNVVNMPGAGTVSAPCDVSSLVVRQGVTCGRSSKSGRQQELVYQKHRGLFFVRSL